MRDVTENSTWLDTEHRVVRKANGYGGAAVEPETAAPEEEPRPAVVEVQVGSPELALLEEAMQLTHLNEPHEVLLVALRELVERQRFLSWVAAHERSERSGTA
jgi:hypothetical protein